MFNSEAVIRFLSPQYKLEAERFSLDDDWYVDIDKKGNLVNVARAVHLNYNPNPDYFINLGVAYNSLARKGGYDDFDSLPRHLKLGYPIISLSDYFLEGSERVTTPFGILPKFILG